MSWLRELGDMKYKEYPNRDSNIPVSRDKSQASAPQPQSPILHITPDRSNQEPHIPYRQRHFLINGFRAVIGVFSYGIERGRHYIRKIGE